MSWLSRLFGRDHESMTAPDPSVPPAELPPSPELSEGQRRLRGHLSTADRAIRAAMTETDNAFAYRGPDRRHHPR